jgi:RNA polymerase sigma-70 factor (ECF subfamily)
MAALLLLGRKARWDLDRRREVAAFARLACPGESTTVRAMGSPPQLDGSAARAASALDAPQDEASQAEQALIARAALGDADAFAEIYDGHAPALLALAQRMLASKTDAQDLLHDVFLEAWQRLTEYDASRASVRAWLMVRLRSRALDRRARAMRQNMAARSELEPSERARTDATVLVPERQLVVRNALAKLDTDVHTVLELTYFEGLTAVEIAARQAAPLGTIKSRLARGLSRLHALLHELEGASP